MSKPQETSTNKHDNSAAEITAFEEFWQQEYVPASSLHDDCPEKDYAKRQSPPAPELVMRSAAEFERRQVPWLWPGRIPLGKLTLLAGDPGLGKSLLTLDLAARVSAGRPWPDEPTGDGSGDTERVGDVIILSAEDDPEDTICPRLLAAGADLGRVHILQHILTGSERLEKSINLDTDFSELCDAIVAVKKPRLLIIDPITAFLGNLDANRNTAIRDLLSPLTKVAAAGQSAIVAVTHLTKRSGGSAIYRAIGSLAFTAAVRGMWAVTRDPHDHTDRRRFLLPVKNNVAIDDNGLAFEIRPARNDVGNGLPAVHWSEPPPGINIQQTLGSPEKRPSESVREAIKWLQTMLAEAPQPVMQLRSQSAAAGIPWIALRSAKTHLGVETRKRDYQGGWVWALPVGARGE